MAWPTSKRHSDAASTAAMSLARVKMARNEVTDGSYICSPKVKRSGADFDVGIVGVTAGRSS